MRSDDPTGQLGPQDWLTHPATRRVIAALEAQGTKVRVVGGCVRDGILNRPVHDVDIATPDPPDVVMQLLSQAGIKALPTGIEHGTVTAVTDGRSFEVTTLRRDVATDGRRATVAFTSDWLEDAKRRDFTINAMSADSEGRIWDPFEGIADLARGWVRFVGDPDQRIAEDVLRLLRFFRFHAYYGLGVPDRAAVNACRRAAHLLPNLSAERVAHEMLRLLEAPDPVSVLVIMLAEDILTAILPEVGAVDRVRQLVWLESRALVREDISPDPVRRLAASLDTDGTGAAAVGARLRLSNARIDRMAAIASDWRSVSCQMTDADAKRVLRHKGPDLFRDLVLTAWADERRVSVRPDASRTAAWTRLLDLARDWHAPSLPVSGGDLVALGLAPGPRVGALLARIEAWWEGQNYQPDRQACLDKAKELLVGST